MSAPAIDAVFDYLALLVAERSQEKDNPLLLSQLQPAILFKFPGFAFAYYGLKNLREFVDLGEKAGYFKLVNTGDVQTMYLLPGPKRRAAAPQPARAITQTASLRQRQWMATVLENLLNAERADQILDAIRDTDALTPEFDAFMGAQEHQAGLYYVKGKLVRLRQFLAVCREKGEMAAAPGWQPSRAMLRTPVIPPIREAPRLGQYIWAVMQDNMKYTEIPADLLTNAFFGVLKYCRAQLGREKAWDWVVGLDILNTQLRELPRAGGAQPQQKRGGLFGVTKPLSPQPTRLGDTLDDEEIDAFAKQLLREAGIRSTQDETAIWRAYVGAEGLEASHRFLTERPELLKEERVLNWLEDQIADAVANNDMSGVRLYANKAAMVIAARTLGLDGMRYQANEIKKIFESVIDGARLLRLVLDYLKAETPPIEYLQTNPEMTRNEAVGDVLDEQLIKAADSGDVGRYRLVSERIDLWGKVVELGFEHGPAQHERTLRQRRDDKMLLTEMGLLLLQGAKDAEARRDILERFPAVATQEGLAMANTTLDILSFREVPKEQYDRYFEVKRLIERCLQLGIDRALAELK